MTTLSHDRLFQLLEAVCEERASADEVAELEALFRGSDDARWAYLTYIDLHGSLLWDAAGGLSVLPGFVKEQAQRRDRSRLRHWAGLAVTCAGICVAALVGLWMLSQHQPMQMADVPHPAPSPSHAPAPVALQKPHAERKPVQLPGSTSTPQIAEAVPETTPAAPPDVPAVNPTNSVAVASTAEGSLNRVVSQMDELLRSSWQRLDVSPAPRAEDAEWVRRIYLDISGRIPTVAEAEAFLADSHRDKRSRLVDALLEDGDYARNFTTVWSQLLVGRSPNPKVDRDAMRKYLRMSFAANRPWNEMVADLVAAEGRTDENGAANFLVAHLNNQAVPATAITAKLFLCTQIQCAQCHNHPTGDMKQAAFWEFNSLFQQAQVVTRRRDIPGGRMGPPIAELVNRDSGGPIYYETTAGLMKVAFPRYNGEEIDPGPQVNRRKELARLMTAGDKPQLAAAFVNRMWAHFLGAGFTHPLDDMSPHNPSSHPELLALLSEEFVRSGYDVKQLIRLICASTAYQLTSRHPSGTDELALGDPATFRQVYVKPMTSEELYDSLLTATQAHQAHARDWTAAEAQREAWLAKFVVSLENDENEETETLAGTHAQALMLMNGELMGEALSLAPGTFLGEIVRDRTSENDKIRKLCLAALSRPPTAKEIPAMQKVIRSGVKTNRPAAGYQDLFWALLNSNEFALVH